MSIDLNELRALISHLLKTFPADVPATVRDVAVAILLHDDGESPDQIQVEAAKAGLESLGEIQLGYLELGKTWSMQFANDRKLPGGVTFAMNQLHGHLDGIANGGPGTLEVDQASCYARLVEHEIQILKRQVQGAFDLFV